MNCGSGGWEAWHETLLILKMVIREGIEHSCKLLATGMLLWVAQSIWDLLCMGNKEGYSPYIILLKSFCHSLHAGWKFRLLEGQWNMLHIAVEPGGKCLAWKTSWPHHILVIFDNDRIMVLPNYQRGATIGMWLNSLRRYGRSIWIMGKGKSSWVKHGSVLIKRGEVTLEPRALDPGSLPGQVEPKRINNWLGPLTRLQSEMFSFVGIVPSTYLWSFLGILWKQRSCLLHQIRVVP